MRGLIIITFTSLIGCTAFPNVSGQVSEAARAASYPQLQPLGPLLAKVEAQSTGTTNTPSTIASLEGRIAALHSRADRLRAPVIEPAIRAHMRRGVAVPAAIR